MFSMACVFWALTKNYVIHFFCFSMVKRKRKNVILSDFLMCIFKAYTFCHLKYEQTFTLGKKITFRKISSKTSICPKGQCYPFKFWNKLTTLSPSYVISPWMIYDFFWFKRYSDCTGLWLSCMKEGVLTTWPPV